MPSKVSGVELFVELAIKDGFLPDAVVDQAYVLQGSMLRSMRAQKSPKADKALMASSAVAAVASMLSTNDQSLIDGNL